MTIRRIFEVGPNNEYHFEPHQILVTYYPESGTMQVALRPRASNTWAARVPCIDKQDDPPITGLITAFDDAVRQQRTVIANKLEASLFEPVRHQTETASPTLTGADSHLDDVGD